ncbi:alpha/beta hydrolase [Flavobacterium sp. MAH-1]|uniref:Alpha/beta hydrolase n=1 Tax=Flavobacterium agri TaxID=2743471 RepID=A0A7Y9C5X3_9FLAO|nr:alpha/beta hydrolase [Flavobacterium agri]NUY79622.1 alpha/beta hydrolase [Flavobacterium agri]NYA69647.1 alpha/beta hydrolase [Flavobacterium agri]
MGIITSKTIVFLNGAFIDHNSWQNWAEFFNGKGFRTVLLPRPEKNAIAAKPAEEDKSPARLGLEDVLAHYEAAVSVLPEKPIVIGHSLGGLVAQILLHRNLVQAAIAIHSFPPAGALYYVPSFLYALWKPIGLFGSLKKGYMVSLSDWKWRITNGMTVDEQIQSYEKYAVPESKRLMRDLFGKKHRIEYSSAHGPLLFIAGDSDEIVGAGLNYRNYLKYKRGNPHSVTAYKEFTGSNYYVVGSPGWKEEAGYAFDFIINN